MHTLRYRPCLLALSMEAPGEERSVGGSATQLPQDASVKATGAISGRGHQWRQPPFRKVAPLDSPLITTLSGSHKEGENSNSVDHHRQAKVRPKFRSEVTASRLSCYCSSPWEIGPGGRAESLAVGGPAAKRILTTSPWQLRAAMKNEVSPQSQHPVSSTASSGDVQEPVSGGPPELTKDLVSDLNKGQLEQAQDEICQTLWSC